MAQIHSNELSDGWEIKEVEKKFYMDTRGSTDPAEWKVLNSWEDPLENEKSIRIVGVVDRIDIHRERGVYRLLDYKTSKKGPKELHLKNSKVRSEEYPNYFFFEQNEKTTRWIDLQLPLYKIWAEKVLLNKDILELEVGIYNVPALEEQFGPKMWTELKDDLLREAIVCVGGVLTDLLAPENHRPVSKVEYDDFENIFFHAPEDAIDQFSI